ncbi:GntR family transcriptional regulator [Proteobacteria bacterium 005FR1]|nr:GntR family transcriptional regulator [Proteobacteria bacterium 005FR1]
MKAIDDWDDSQPIYRQLRDRIVALIIDGTFKEGEAIPSVRQVASEYRINHLTVSKAYQDLVDEDLLQKRRGLGMFVAEGAQQRLLEKERNQFMETEVPALLDRMQRLGVSPERLIDLINKQKSKSK